MGSYLCKKGCSIFFAPPAGGTVLGYIELARHFQNLGEHYGIQAIGLYDDEKLEYLSFAEMVLFCLESIGEKYRPGIDYIAGHSFGGQLAFAMTNKLVEQDMAPKGLIILDTLPRLDLIKTDLQHNINEDDFTLFLLTMGIGNMINIDQEKFKNMSYDEIKKEIIKIAKRDNTISSFLNAQYLDKYLKLQLHHILISREIRLSKIRKNIPTYVVRTTEQEKELYDMFLEWNNYIEGKAKIIDIEANHTSMMKRPYIIDLARNIEEVIK